MPVEQVGHREVGQQPPATEDDEVVGRVLHLAHEVAGDEHGAPLVGEVAQQFAHPPDALGIQPVDRLVEQQHVRVAEQRRRDAEPLPHAEREAAHPLVRDGLEADEVDHLVDPGDRQPVGLRERPQVGGARCAPGAGLRGSMSAPTRRMGCRSDRYGRPSTVAVPEVGRVRPRTQRIVVVLPDPLGPRKPVTRPGSDRHGEVVDGDPGAVRLGQARRARSRRQHGDRRFPGDRGAPHRGPSGSTRWERPVRPTRRG